MIAASGIEGHVCSCRQAGVSGALPIAGGSASSEKGGPAEAVLAAGLAEAPFVLLLLLSLLVAAAPLLRGSVVSVCTWQLSRSTGDDDSCRLVMISAAAGTLMSVPVQALDVRHW